MKREVTIQEALTELAREQQKDTTSFPKSFILKNTFIRFMRAEYVKEVGMKNILYSARLQLQKI